MRVLLTRPIAESERLAALLRSRGHVPVISPVLEIHLSDGPPLAADNIQAILVTSANGVRALTRRMSVREIPVFAVGPQTSEAAHAAGFVHVRQADGDSTALVRAVETSLQPEVGPLLLATGGERTGDVETKLTTLGFTVRVAELYEAVEIRQLTAEAAWALAENEIDAVMLFSPRSAVLFARQIQSANLQTKCERIAALCISVATASALSPLHFGACRIASRPDRDAMLQLLNDSA